MAIAAGIVFLIIGSFWFYTANYTIRDLYKENSISKIDAIFMYLMANGVGLAAIIVILSSMYVSA